MLVVLFSFLLLLLRIERYTAYSHSCLFVLIMVPNFPVVHYHAALPPPFQSRRLRDSDSVVRRASKSVRVCLNASAARLRGQYAAGLPRLQMPFDCHGRLRPA